MTVPKLRSLADIVRFETEKTFEERYPYRSIYDIFRQSGETFEDKVALTFLMTGEDEESPRNVSYTELLGGVTRAANFFSDLAGPGSGVGIMLPHLVETYFAQWGAETAGYALPINFLLQVEHIAHLLRAGDVSVLVAFGPSPGSDIWQKARAVAELIPGLKLVQVSPPNVPVQDGAVAFAEVARYSGSALSFGQPRQGNEIAALFHTGGTTGKPKLVAHTHTNQLIAACGGAIMLGFSEQDVLPHGLPLFHVAGTIACGLAPISSGTRLLILSPAGYRNPTIVRNIWKIFKRHGATIAGGIPTVMAAHMDVPLEGKLDSISFGITGAAPAPKALIEQYEQKTGAHVHEMYGMTECGGLAAVSPRRAERVTGSVGYRLPYTRTSIRKLRPDGSLGPECGPREIGVLTISGPTVTPGYRGSAAPAEGAHGQILNTGDLAYTDDEGRIYIAGRAKDLIIRSGHNIDPAMIEEAVGRHPAVSLAAAVGQPDRYAGEVVACYVKLRDGFSVTVEELRQFAEPLIAERPAWPKRYYIVDAIPVTAIGKIFKPDLRADAAQRLITDLLAGGAGQGPRVDVSIGGARGMQVSVTLSSNDPEARRKVEDLLQGYSFEFTVSAFSAG